MSVILFKDEESPTADQSFADRSGRSAWEKKHFVKASASEIRDRPNAALRRRQEQEATFASLLNLTKNKSLDQSIREEQPEKSRLLIPEAKSYSLLPNFTPNSAKSAGLSSKIELPSFEINKMRNPLRNHPSNLNFIQVFEKHVKGSQSRKTSPTYNTNFSSRQSRSPLRNGPFRIGYRHF